MEPRRTRTARQLETNVEKNRTLDSTVQVCDVMLMRELHKRFHEKTGVCFASLYPGRLLLSLSHEQHVWGQKFAAELDAGCIAETNLFREHYPVFRSVL